MSPRDKEKVVEIPLETSPRGSSFRRKSVSCAPRRGGCSNPTALELLLLLLRESSIRGRRSLAATSRAQQRVPALHLRRLSRRSHVVPMLQLLGPGAVQTEAEPADHLSSLPAHSTSSAIVHGQEERDVSQLEQSDLREEDSA